MHAVGGETNTKHNVYVCILSALACGGSVAMQFISPRKIAQVGVRSVQIAHKPPNNTDSLSYLLEELFWF